MNDDRKLKWQEAAFALSPQKVKHDDFDIEVVKAEPFDGGVQVFARAWRNGEQVGFGDGSVDVERFRFHDPLFRVSEKENIKEFMLRELGHSVSIVAKHGAKGIVVGKVGNTTSTFYSVAGANSPCDGNVRRSNKDETFANLRSGAGDSNDGAMSSYLELAFLIASATTNQFKTLYRGIINFNTAAIPDGDTISSATWSGYGFVGQTKMGNDSVHIVSVTPASTAGVQNDDYADFGTTSFGSTVCSVFSGAAYQDITLNASGISAINKTGVTSLGFRLGWDVSGTFGGAWSSNDMTGAIIKSADSDSGAYAPKLVVEHSPPSSIKTIMDLAKASVKTVNGLAIASVKTINGLS